MRTEITKLFLQNTIEISELQELADALLLRCLLSDGDEDALNWYNFIDRLYAWAKLHGASILVHGDYIQEYLAESTISAMIAFGIEHTVRKSCVYPEPVEGVSECVWWCI